MENLGQVTTYPIIMGGIIKNIRERLGFDQRTMAEKMSLSQAAWSKIETGKTVISVVQLQKISNILGMPASEIIGYTDDAVKNIKENNINVQPSSNDAGLKAGHIIGGAALALFIMAVLKSK
tara:strand:+ start:71 stop:436 length:366 start_codon:yes stop_codon:yes gene_type:complete